MLPTASTTSSRAMVAACEAMGIDSKELFERAGVARAQIDDPDGRIPLQTVAALWEAAIALTRDPGLGLKVAVATPFGAYRVIDFLAASASTVGEGLAAVARYFPLINTALGWDIAVGSETVRMALSHPMIPGLLPRLPAEYTLAVTVLHCRKASGFDWPLVEVELAFDEPASSKEHQAVFGCPVRFGASANAFVMARSVWDRPTASGSSELLRALQAHADDLVARLGIDQVVARKVQRLLVEELRGGEPTLARLAKRMAMSARTLQRRLDGEGTTFAAVLDDTRRELAGAYMAQRDVALADVSYLLGFSEQSAFTRAFQRWHGVAPSRYAAPG
jgi:AraC-like DNA-binding protein